MKTLLINPYFQAVTKYERVEMPLGLMYIAAVLEENNFPVRIIDASVGQKRLLQKDTWHYGDTLDELIIKVKKEQPDIVGIGCFFSMRFPYVLEVAREIKKINKDIIIAIGGIHPTVFTEQILKDYPFFDYIILGEGEYSFLDLIKVIQSRDLKKLQEIDGLAYCQAGRILINPKTKFIENLDTLPFPARHLVPVEDYLRDSAPVNWGLGANRQFAILTSRSCPNKCSFCSMYLIHGARWRARSAENVLEEIELLVNQYQAKELCIEDDNLTLSKQRILDICQGMIDRGIKVKWNTPNGVAVRYLDYEILQKMKEAGCVCVNLAIESGDEHMRNTVIGKNLSQEKIYEVVRICKKIGLKANGYFVLGMPGETKKSLENTNRILKDLPFNGLSIFFATPFPGTKLFQWVTDGKMMDDTTLDDIIKGNFILFNRPVIKLDDVDFDDLIRYKKKMIFTWMRRNFFDIVWSILRGKNDFFNIPSIVRFLKFYLPSK
ncbi:MAG: radical SAM protein [Patescibacteria group bacterium]